MMVTPELRNASSRRRCSSVFRSKSMCAKVCSDGRKVTSVPVRNSPFSRLGADAGDRQRARPGRRAAKRHLVLLAAAIDRQLQPLGERVHHRDADAVQAAGDLVGVLVELPAGVQLGHDDLGRRDAFALVDVGGDAAAVVGDGDRAVGVEDHLDARGPAAPAPRRWRCRPPRRPCGAGPSRRRCRRCTCPGRLRTASRPFRTLMEFGAVVARRRRRLFVGHSTFQRDEAGGVHTHA